MECEENHQDELRVRVDEIRRLLDMVDTINLFHLIINPHDFGQSVENLYHFSFLVRDGLCALYLTNNGEPVVCRREPSTHKEDIGGINRHQMIMEFDMVTWKRAIDVFNIHEPFIPHRMTEVVSCRHV
ncbi:Nse4 C-terminal-domain-containing protein [Suillus tomentosus]|nr:Nse4 C-terminal-domain-containing protein [Suillus tomentosus]